MTIIAPVCPTSRSELKPLPQTIVDAIRRIPRATDLHSAIIAINRINNVLVQITRNAPQVNNVFKPSLPSVPGTGAPKASWIEEDRSYQVRSIINPDDTSQKIDVKVLVKVTFRNPATDFLLEYDN